MRSRLGDRARLNHILDAISEIEAYLQNADYETFLKHSMMRFACIKQLEIINDDLPELKANVVNILVHLSENQGF